jgi:hypothetical protein
VPCFRTFVPDFRGGNHNEFHFYQIFCTMNGLSLSIFLYEFLIDLYVNSKASLEKGKKSCFVASSLFGTLKYRVRCYDYNFFRVFDTKHR